MYCGGSKQSLFLENIKKMICIENSLFGGSCRKSATISQIGQNWWFYFVYKALEQSVTGSVF